MGDLALREKILKVFTIYECSGHTGNVTLTVLILVFLFSLSLAALYEMRLQLA